MSLSAGDEGVESSVLGRWEAGGSESGFGTALDVLPDGRLVIAILVQAEIEYRLDGDRLTLKIGTPQDPQEQSLEFTIEDDTMTLRHPETGETTRKKRVGAPVPGAPPIVGVWTHKGMSDQDVYERYTADGRCEFRLPLGAKEGRYRLHGMEGEGGKRVPTLRREGKVLVCEEADGEVIRFRRVASPAWYPLPSTNNPARERIRRKMLTRVFSSLGRDGVLTLRYGPSSKEFEVLGTVQGRLGGSPEERRLALEYASTALTALMKEKPDLREKDGYSRLVFGLRVPSRTPWAQVAQILRHLNASGARIHRFFLRPDEPGYQQYFSFPKQPVETSERQISEEVPLIMLRRVGVEARGDGLSCLVIRVGPEQRCDLAWPRTSEHEASLEALAAAMKRRWTIMGHAPGARVRFVPTEPGEAEWRYGDVRDLITAANRAGLTDFDFAGAMPTMTGGAPPKAADE